MVDPTVTPDEHRQKAIDEMRRFTGQARDAILLARKWAQSISYQDQVIAKLGDAADAVDGADTLTDIYEQGL